MVNTSICSRSLSILEFVRRGGAECRTGYMQLTKTSASHIRAPAGIRRRTAPPGGSVTAAAAAA